MTSMGHNVLPGVLAWVPGPWEIALILLIALLLFGGKKLPELARGLARALRGFKEELNATKKDIEDAGKADQDKPDKPDKPDST